MKLIDKTAFVTGAASGIGRAVAVRFAQEGAKLVLTDLNSKGLEETQKLANLKEKDVLIKTIDITNYNDVEVLVSEAISRFGCLDIEANIAGILVRKSLIEHTIEDWEQVLKVNLTGVFNCIKAIAPHMMERRYGKIINMGSIAGMVGYGYPSYAASKAGVVNLTRQLAIELSPFKININAICPGVIRTPMIKPELENQYISKTPIGRLGETEDIADAALYLVSDEAGFVNGTTLVLDGGAIGTFRYFD